LYSALRETPLML